MFPANQFKIMLTITTASNFKKAFFVIHAIVLSYKKKKSFLVNVEFQKVE